MTRLVSTMGILVVLLLSIVSVYLWQCVGTGRRLSYFLKAVTDGGLYCGNHGTFNKWCGTNKDMMVLTFRKCFNSHFGRHDRTSQVEKHQYAIRPIHLVECIYDFLN